MFRNEKGNFGFIWIVFRFQQTTPQAPPPPSFVRLESMHSLWWESLEVAAPLMQHPLCNMPFQALLKIATYASKFAGDRWCMCTGCCLLNDAEEEELIRAENLHVRTKLMQCSP
ncbi:hypothetical protein GOP47_0006665 [Adiantum capillus-veneris]|uniref:Uncharacterized protein n=1 Tax=Adiantum capillus-veneris TaxID=13818 RepID=A0A9D4V3Q2_ADICA|nr:hypothetical protein GOP47_0006665 [Adiantum capillus-veneris]